MKYPGVVLKGRKARGEVISIALANDGQHQDTGAKMIHAADETTSNIVSKSISHRQRPRDVSRPRARAEASQGLQEQHRVRRAAHQLDSRTDTYPAITVRGTGNACQHEASVSQVTRGADLLHAAARPHRGAGDEP